MNVHPHCSLLSGFPDEFSGKFFGVLAHWLVTILFIHLQVLFVRKNSAIKEQLIIEEHNYKNY